MRPSRRAPTLAVLFLAAGCGAPAHEAPDRAAGAGVEAAELILVGGDVVTLDPERPRARAVALRAGRIVAVGDDGEVESYAGPQTRRIDLQGRCLVPGFIEGHAHFLGIGDAALELDLREAPSFEAMVELVAGSAARAPAGEWIRGRGWHQEKWAASATPRVEGVPVHAALSRAVPDHPVLLVHASGHAALVNARALELAGIDARTPDPPGGTIVRDADGAPTGLLRENAADLVERASAAAPGDPAREAERFRRRVELAAATCLRHGITSFQDAGSSFDTIDRLAELARRGELPLRLWVMVGEPNRRLESGLAGRRWIGLGDGFLTVRAIKRYADGALGSHGAWLLEPYADLPGSTGLATTPLAELEATARVARDAGWQLCVHAIGDRANRAVLDLYERTLGERAPEARWRIEHAQHLAPSDVPRFAELGVVAAMQGVHCTSDGPWVPERLGAERARSGAYVWRDLLDAGARIANGTDAPVEDVDPIACFAASVTRRMADGRAFHPEQRMTRLEALRSYTLDAAYAAFEEHEKGSIAPGKLGDLTLLTQNLLEVPEEVLRETRVLATIVGGRVAYAADDAPAALRGALTR